MLKLFYMAYFCYELEYFRDSVLKPMELHPVSLGSTPTVPIWVIGGGRMDIGPELLPAPMTVPPR